MHTTPEFAIRVQLRWMIRRDMAEVQAIENQSYEYRWSEDDFVLCLRQRQTVGMVAEFDDRVVGFMVYEQVLSHLQVLNFTVHPEFRRHGVGRQMADKLASKLTFQGRNKIVLEVRETNLAAQLFFKKMGFKATSVIRDFYDDTTEDAYRMQFNCQPIAKEPPSQNQKQITTAAQSSQGEK